MNVLTSVTDKHVQNPQNGVGSKNDGRLLSGRKGKAGLEAAPRRGLVLLVGVSSLAIGFWLALQELLLFSTSPRLSSTEVLWLKPGHQKFGFLTVTY